MISDGSCDTEDWSNDAENPVLHYRNKLHFKIQISYFKYIFYNITLLGGTSAQWV